MVPCRTYSGCQYKTINVLDCIIITTWRGRETKCLVEDENYKVYSQQSALYLVAQALLIEIYKNYSPVKPGHR